MNRLKNSFLNPLIFTAMIASGTAFAISPDTGQLIIVNNLGNGSSGGNVGLTQSSIKIEVYDTTDNTQPCTTVTNLAYGGVTIVRWSAVGKHSAIFCTGTGTGTAAIYQVKITPLPNIVGQAAQVVYDATATTPQAAASAISFTPPTTVYGTMALVINGTGTPNTTSGQTADSTHWGFTVNPITPVFDTGNGAILITGIPGVDGAYGVEAEKIFRHHGILP
jgi:hypothetical protein